MLVRDGGTFFLLAEGGRGLSPEKRAVLDVVREALRGVECPVHRGHQADMTHLVFRAGTLEVDRTCCEAHRARLRERLAQSLRP